MLGATSAVAQDLDPRAYARVPVGFTIATAGVSVSSGGVLTDPTLPVENAHAKVWTPSIGIAQSFGLFGRTAQTLVALPYSWAHVTGDVAEQVQQVDRSGLSDMRFRFSVLLAGAPAMTPQQVASSPRKPIVGASLTVAAPTGQYYPNRLINLGTNRWAFKPEVGLSHPIVVAPRGTRVYGVVSAVDSGSKMKGQSSVAVTLTDMKIGDRIVSIKTKPVTAAGSKGTGAKKMVGGAAIGAIAGGGQGAAIGAAVGAGAGGVATAASSVTPAVIAAQSPQAFALAAPLQVEIMTNVAVR